MTRFSLSSGRMVATVHGVALKKRGTLVVMKISRGTDTGQISFPSKDDLKIRLYHHTRGFRIVLFTKKYLHTLWITYPAVTKINRSRIR